MSCPNYPWCGRGSCPDCEAADSNVDRGLNRQARNPEVLPDARPKVENALETPQGEGAFQEGERGGHSQLRQVGTPDQHQSPTPSPSDTAAWLHLRPKNACGGEHDLRPEDFKVWWGSNRDALCSVVNTVARPGMDIELAPAWVLDEISMAAHNISLAGWQACLSKAKYRETVREQLDSLEKFEASERMSAEAHALVSAYAEHVDKRAQALRRRDRSIECVAAIAGLAGAALLAFKGDYAGWGWVAFLASNGGWIAFGVIRRHWFLVLQQVGFTFTSLLGIARWLL